MKNLYLLGIAASFIATDALADDNTVSEPLAITITKYFDNARNTILPETGVSDYTVTQTQLDTQSQGENAPFNEVLLRAPSVAEDSFGQVHVRGEHANLQYRINGILLPEGISGFGQELDTRFAQSVTLLTGALPAQYGDRTSGVVDIQTKSGAFDTGGNVSMYGGSHSDYNPSLEYGGSSAGWNYFANGSYLHSDLGIENPTSSRNPIHDMTDQEKGFLYLSHTIDPTSRISLILSSSIGDFQIPNNPNQTPGFTITGASVIPSADLKETQQEENHYAILAYQKSLDDFNYQLAAFSRYSSVLFNPDTTGDLEYNGIASHVDRTIISNGVEADGSYRLNSDHTLRAGLISTIDRATSNTFSQVFAGTGSGDTLTQTGFTPEGISDDHAKTGYLYGTYLQDEWRLTSKLTLNYGARADAMQAFVSGSQLSPRLNAVYKATDTTTLHAGYARYFTPPPMELVNQSSISLFNGTTGNPPSTEDSAVKPERAHYFDAGVMQRVTSHLQLGADAYYKVARNLLDEGQFGQALIFSPFNYHFAQIKGGELTATYKQDAFSAYANYGYVYTSAKGLASGQFEFGSDEQTYINSHAVHLDHDQRATASAGAAYTLRDTTFSTDLIYGSGLRHGFANTSHLPSYTQINLSVEQTLSAINNGLKARLDVINLFDKSYEIRDGTGIGVGAPQFGPRRAFYAGMSETF